PGAQRHLIAGVRQKLVGRDRGSRDETVERYVGLKRLLGHIQGTDYRVSDWYMCRELHAETHVHDQRDLFPYMPTQALQGVLTENEFVSMGIEPASAGNSSGDATWISIREEHAESTTI